MRLKKYFQHLCALALALSQAPLAPEVACTIVNLLLRPALEREEFDAQLLEPSNRAWVAWDDRMPVSMTLVSTHVRTTRWLSEEYFARHYPERHRAGQVHYIVWVVVDPDADPHGANLLLAQQALAVEAKEGALLVFDVPETHEPGATEGAGRAAELDRKSTRLNSSHRT